MRKIQTSYNKFNSNSIVCMGDSLTMNFIWGTLAHQFYPHILQELLKSSGCKVQSRNFGISGNTTTQMLSRIGAMTQFDKPKIAVIYGATNDPGNSISSATTINNLQSMAQTMLSTGAKVIICGQHYNNYSTGGDTTVTPTGGTGTTWNNQKQAYTNLVGANSGNIAFCDFYGYMRNLIDTGKVVQGDWTAWHVADQNVHLNPQGESYLAQALLQTIQAQNGWIDLLKN